MFPENIFIVNEILLKQMVKNEHEFLSTAVHFFFKHKVKHHTHYKDWLKTIYSWLKIIYIGMFIIYYKHNWW